MYHVQRSNRVTVVERDKKNQPQKNMKSNRVDCCWDREIKFKKKMLAKRNWMLQFVWEPKIWRRYKLRFNKLFVACFGSIRIGRGFIFFNFSKIQFIPLKRIHPSSNSSSSPSFVAYELFTQNPKNFDTLSHINKRNWINQFFSMLLIRFSKSG